MDTDIKEDMAIAVLTAVDPQKLINYIFPEVILPKTVDYVWDKLLEKGEILPPALKRSRWLRWPTKWGNPRNGETEGQLATFLEGLCEEVFK